MLRHVWALIMKKKMKACLYKAFITVVLFAGVVFSVRPQTGALFTAETTVSELTGLTLAECVMVLNYKMDYQVNLEAQELDPSSVYRLDLVGLQKQSIDEVMTNLLSQTGDYVFLRAGKTINVIPKEQRNDQNYVFNSILHDYKVEGQNLVGAWE